MNVLCRTCSNIFPVEESYVGSTVYCPKCGGEVFVANRAAKPKPVHHEVPVKEDSHERLCFILGMMFPVLGLIAGAVIGKERGFFAAILGHLTDGVIGLMCGLMIYFLNKGIS